MNLDLDLIRVNRVLYGGPVRRAFWRLIHKMPCAVVHRVCPLCRDEDMCDRCCEEAFQRGTPVQVVTRSTTELPSGWFRAPIVSTYTSGTSITLTNTNPWGNR